MRRRVIAATLALTAALMIGVAGCGDDDSDGGAAGADPVEDVQELAAALDDVGGGCALEYEGLTDDQREVSICTLGDGTAELSVWTDADAQEDLVRAAEESGDPVVVGPNWTIDVTEETLVDDVAAATGGEVRP